jgi:hypothetical protein
VIVQNKYLNKNDKKQHNFQTLNLKLKLSKGYKTNQMFKHKIQNIKHVQNITNDSKPCHPHPYLTYGDKPTLHEPLPELLLNDCILHSLASLHHYP